MHLRQSRQKQPMLYLLIIFVWSITLLLFIDDLMIPISKAAGIVLPFVVVSTVFIIYFWLNGVKDVVYTAFYYLNRPKCEPPKGGFVTEPLVELVYCTYNDFNKHSLTLSMGQSYKNFRTVILDDSTKEEYRRDIDTFAEKHNVTVVRRKDHEGFKAGNLNNYLKRSDADYWVILDSDEVIPSDFIVKTLEYMSEPSTGIVQGNHVATNDQNAFMQIFSQGVESHWISYQSMKDKHGFLSFLGHGALIRAEAYRKTGGFPHLVAEDLCFSIELRNMGYYVRFAPDVICYEEYPVSYLAFKKRHSKWTQGNMEFIKKYTTKVLASKMTWFEKLDIVLFTYNLPLTAMFATFILINIVIFPALGFDTNYSLEMIVPTILFLCAPLLNDFVYYSKKKSIPSLAYYAVHCVLLYGSMLFISIKSSLTSMFGKAFFLVTPKTSEKIEFRQALLYNHEEIMFGLCLAFISWYWNYSILPVLLIVFPTFTSFYLTMLSNRPIKTDIVSGKNVAVKLIPKPII